VAGGADGLFLLRPGSTTLQRFTIADGLHPYGYMPDGSPADKNPSLSATPVIAVQGGPAGTVFVGYQGKPGCEDNWDGPNPDPANYKSGDADRVTVDANGKLTVVHYDIFSGPGVVGAELRGREKLCSVYRIAWDPAQDKVWFGANHGFAVGTADYPGNPTCNGQYPGNQSRTNCAGVWEHSHPHIGGCSVEQTPCPSNKAVLLTDSYYGAAVDPATHDVWFGGLIRTTKYHYGTYGGGLGAYYNAEEDTETQGFAPGTCTAANPRGKGIPCAGDDRWDLWPDKVPECTPRPTATNPNNCESNYVTPGQRNDDAVSGIVALADRTAWVSSFAQGLVRIDSFGKVLEDPSAKLMTTFVSALGRDPSDGSLWAGMSWGPGITRYDPAKGAATNYSTNLFGDLAWARIGDVQADATVTPRRMLVAFRQNGSTPGFVAIYSGN